MLGESIKMSLNEVPLITGTQSNREYLMLSLGIHSTAFFRVSMGTKLCLEFLKIHATQPKNYKPD